MTMYYKLHKQNCYQLDVVSIISILLLNCTSNLLPFKEPCHNMLWLLLQQGTTPSSNITRCEWAFGYDSSIFLSKQNILFYFIEDQ